MSRLSPRTLRIIAVTVSVLLTLLIVSYLSNLQSETKETSSMQQSTVAVASMDVPKNTLIKADMVKLVNLPQEGIQKDACHDVQEVIGTTAKEPIYAGEQFNKRRLFEDEKMAGFIGLIPKDKRAISIAITDVTGVTGFAKPGNYVDVILVSDKGNKSVINGKILLQNMMLLAVNKNENTEKKDNAEEKMATATLAASPEEAVRLAVAQQEGTLYLTLRPLHPENKLVLTSEISIFKPTIDIGRAEPTRPMVSLDRPKIDRGYFGPDKSRTEKMEPVGDRISVIRGNTVQSVTAR